MIDPETYRTVCKQGGVLLLGTVELLLLHWADRLDFLHRISTNDLRSMAPRSVRETILASEKGRVIDVVTLINREDLLAILPSPGFADTTRQWLERFIVADDVVIGEESGK